MRFFNKIISVLLSLLIMISVALPVSAQSSEKEEVIYIMTNANGSVDGVYAVSIFNSGDITDYGEYNDVKMLNTSDEITVDGDKITFRTDSDKAYMQGTLTNAEIPWIISIKYFLNGVEMTADEIAGKSGDLEIRFSIEKNKNCKTNFFNSYALQSTFTLDTKLCSEITADDATIANVGSNKQLTYTILPNKGIDTKITAKVENFEMSAVSINGIKMNLDLDVDSSEITDKVSDLSEGIDKIDDGAKQVYNGSNELKDGGNTLKSNSSNIYGGTKNLDNGIDELLSGINTFQSGLDEINSQSENLTSGSSQVKSALEKIQTSLDSVSADAEELKKLTSASGQIKTAITNLKKGASELKSNLEYVKYKATMSANGLDIDKLYIGNSQAIKSLTAQISQLNETLNKIQGNEKFKEQAEQLQAQISQLTDIVTLLTGNNGMISGTEQYLNGLSGGVLELYAGLEQLETNYNEFDKSINKLANNLSEMLVNISKLSDGIDTLVNQYKTLDGGIKSYTGGVEKIVKGFLKIKGGASDLAKGSNSLVEGTETFDGGIASLYSGITELSDGAGELYEGTDKIKNKTSGMDGKINDKIDDVISSISGSESETCSFVSDKNTDVTSVQFVIKTDKIEVREKESEEISKEEKLTFWQKLLRLFGIY